MTCASWLATTIGIRTRGVVDDGGPTMLSNMPLWRSLPLPAAGIEGSQIMSFECLEV